MILRYTVETKNSPAFTASKIVKGDADVIIKIIRLERLNVKAGYKKYSNFRLYTDDNKLINQ